MRLKKGFTLAEILIVLMVIGVIATMTVPSMMKGVQEAQYKTGFKKAYNTLTNLTGKLGVEGKMPAASGQFDITSFFIAMMDNLSVREVYLYDPAQRAAAPGTAVRGVTYWSDGTQRQFGPAVNAFAIAQQNNTSVDNYWIITDDGIAYTLEEGPQNATCSEKGVISRQTTEEQMSLASCFRILVDVNGVNKAPNLLEPQSYGLTRGNAMTALTGDRFHVYVGRDGVTTGNSGDHAAARIVADMK